MRILIIDDEEDIRELIKDILEEFHIGAVTAENCKEGLDLLEHDEKVDAVFVDWKTPIMNGIEFTNAVRSRAKLKDLNLMMVTGNTEMDDIKEALNTGVNEYLMKPFTPDMIKIKLEMLGFEMPSNML